MKDFYIFLDIDGTLNDREFIDTFKKSEDSKKVFSNFKPESVEALNYLIEQLSLNYDVNLVISSCWRHFMNRTMLCLNKNKVNLEKVKRINKTCYLTSRDEEIKQFLKERNETKNFVAIDDEADDFKIPKRNKIKTNFETGALSLNHVKTFLCLLTQEFEK